MVFVIITDPFNWVDVRIRGVWLRYYQVQRTATMIRRRELGRTPGRAQEAELRGLRLEGPPSALEPTLEQHSVPTVPGRVLIESRGKFRGAPGSLRLAAPGGPRLFGKCFAVQRAQLAISNSLGATPSLGLQSSGSSVHGGADTRLRENSPENLCAARDFGCAGSRPCGAGALR